MLHLKVPWARQQSRRGQKGRGPGWGELQGERGAPSPRTVLKAGGRHKASRPPIAQAWPWHRLALAHSICRNENAIYQKPPSKQKPSARRIPLASLL